MTELSHETRAALVHEALRSFRETKNIIFVLLLFGVLAGFAIPNGSVTYFAGFAVATFLMNIALRRFNGLLQAAETAVLAEPPSCLKGPQYAYHLYQQVRILPHAFEYRDDDIAAALRGKTASIVEIGATGAIYLRVGGREGILVDVTDIEPI